MTSLWLIFALTGASVAEAAPARGLEHALALRRAELVSDVRYELRLSVSTGAAVSGTARIRFKAGRKGEYVLDFQAPPDHLLDVDRRHRFENDHILFKAREGENELNVEFRSPATAVHAGRDLVYTLLVPDRAKELFPCFDQPDLKARFRLTLDLPPGWKAVSNAPVESVFASSAAFRETRPLPTYLFAFAAGRLETIEERRDGRLLRMFHTADDAKKARKNARAVFDLHAKSLAWLEEYTGAPYPWEKFEFVAVPSFQYRGMEHPGAVYYRSDTVLLDESATEEERLARAGTIAHETAHMWFGGNVTMRWFDDVWTKESFANFMADKITAPMFPKIDFDLRFLAAHAHRAAAVDRGEGTHALRQDLPNLSDAGALYGPLIYHKSPFVLRQIEAVMGEAAFRKGIGEVQRLYAYGNASWDEIVAVLGRETGRDLGAFSRQWVNTPGRPVVSARWTAADDEIKSLEIRQSGAVWPQLLHVFIPPSAILPVLSDAPSVQVPAARGLPAPEFLLVNGRGWGYGLFPLDETSAAHALPTPSRVPRALARAVLWESLYEKAVGGGEPAAFVEDAVEALREENDEQVLASLIGSRGKLQSVFWLFLSAADRSALHGSLEELLWTRLREPSAPALKLIFLRAFRDLAVSETARERLNGLLADEGKLGIKIPEKDLADLALAAALRGNDGGAGIVEATAARLQSLELRDKMRFLARAVSPDAGKRRAWFRALKDPANRRKEPWVEDGLRLLNHPLRAAESLEFLEEALGLLEEIQATGDIFFPEMWASGALSGHSSPEAAALVRGFLKSRASYPRPLRLKILQAADLLFRSARLNDGGERLRLQWTP